MESVYLTFETFQILFFAQSFDDLCDQKFWFRIVGFP